ncbi:MAG: tRNA (5-methylaminomethyl-2-thiouridylate)-methyltransferase [Candidatus Kapaibacterium sp.]|nr:MAG: tRNA (5-methylaminomethyl-2-thiouridylate)-methyltransferase [Candidatus Kapabacteria bacterium]
MKRALLLFSKGLDSLLAGKIIESQGIQVVPITYITPFFNWEYHNNPQKYYEYCKSLGFQESYLIDITEEYLSILKKPRYGFGCLANPCVACKTFMISKTKKLLNELQADFIVTGEVLGQRPKSQNKWAMEVIKDESGADDLLVRPLSAKLLPPSLPERLGWIDREKLYGISGRNRQMQFQLAKKFNIKNFPTPAGGCLLTDPEIGRRMLKILKEKRTLNPLTAKLSVQGRHFFTNDSWIVLGRNHKENVKLFNLVRNQLPVFTLSVPAPIAVVVEGTPTLEYIKDLLIRYSKKAQKHIANGFNIEIVQPNPLEFTFESLPTPHQRVAENN